MGVHFVFKQLLSDNFCHILYYTYFMSFKNINNEVLLVILLTIVYSCLTPPLPDLFCIFRYIVRDMLLKEDLSTQQVVSSIGNLVGS